MGIFRILTRALFGHKSTRSKPQHRKTPPPSPWPPVLTPIPKSTEPQRVAPPPSPRQPARTTVPQLDAPQHETHPVCPEPVRAEEPRTISGYAYVIDGDTIVVKRTKLRLAGIDAPELDHPWGQKSKWAMVKICKGHMITAHLTGEVSHDRMVATCYLADGRDIGAELIKQGLALDWALFSSGKYRHLEQHGVRKKFMGFRTMHKS